MQLHLENGNLLVSLNNLTYIVTMVLLYYFSFRYFEFEVLTAGPMRVGWAKVDSKPGFQLGQDDCSWAYDGWRVRFIENFFIIIHFSNSF